MPLSKTTVLAWKREKYLATWAHRVALISIYLALSKTLAHKRLRSMIFRCSVRSISMEPCHEKSGTFNCYSRSNLNLRVICLPALTVINMTSITSWLLNFPVHWHLAPLYLVLGPCYGALEMVGLLFIITAPTYGRMARLSWSEQLITFLDVLPSHKRLLNTHSHTNRARRKATSVIENTALPRHY